MTTYDFPSITPSGSSWELVTNTRRFTSPLTNATQTVARKGTLWRVDLSFNNLDGADRADLQAFLTKLNGQEHRFTLHDHAYTRRGTGGGTPLIDGASQTGSSVTIDGATASVTNWLRAGDYLSFNNQLFMTTADCNSDGSGDVTVTLSPPIRSAPADDAAVDIDAPVSGVFMLATDPSWSNRPGAFSSFQMTCIEDVLA